VKVEAVELRRVRLPLVTPFRTAHGVQTVRETLLLRVIGPDGEGWGECAALEEPTYTAEYVDGAEAVLRAHLLPLLFGGGSVSAADVASVLAPVKGHPMAKAAVEMAVLDAELRIAGERLVDRLGGVRDAVDAGVAVGITGSVTELVDAVAGYVDQGYRRVKLKISPGWDVVPVRAVRERFGDGLFLQVDANGSYAGVDAVAALGALDRFDLLLVEQPLGDDDLLGHAALARRIATPVCLDESIVSVASAAAAIELGACSVVNLKPGRVGGYLEAKRIHDLCRARGIGLWCGGMLETGLGRAANVALAALPGFTLPGDLSASDRYFATDITEPFVLDAGRLRVPTGPGIGVEPIPEALDAVTVTAEVIHPDH
jgi:O-succinylbenzoate synthase